MKFKYNQKCIVKTGFYKGVKVTITKIAWVFFWSYTYEVKYKGHDGLIKYATVNENELDALPNSEDE